MPPRGDQGDTERDSTADLSYAQTESEEGITPVAMTFEDRIFRYAQLARQGSVAIYSQMHKASGIVRYETVVLRVFPATTFPSGKSFPEREGYPPATAWGQRGWSFYTRADAQAQFTRLVDAHT